MITAVNCLPKAIQILSRLDWELIKNRLPHDGYNHDGTIKGYSIEEMIELCWLVGFTLWTFPVQFQPVALILKREHKELLLCGELPNKTVHAVVCLNGLYLDATTVYGSECPLEKITVVGKLEKWRY